MPKRILQGQVVSDRANKTIIVSVERRFTHKLYKKVVRRTRRFMAHDPRNHYKIGDTVRIRECPPRSRHKCWEALYGGANASGGSGAVAEAEKSAGDSTL